MTDQVSNPNGVAPVVPVQADPLAPAPAPAEPSAIAVDPNSLFANQLSSITTDDGRQKYTDVNTALSSIPHAQNHINELGSKVKELEEELAKRVGAEELLASLQQTQAPAAAIPAEGQMDESAIQNVVNNMLQSNAQQQTADANANTVRQAISEKFGDAASVEFANKAKELGMDVGTLTSMAKSTPQVVLSLFNTAPVRDPQPTSVSSVHIPAAPAGVVEEDYMAKFRGSDTGLSGKWAKAKADAANNQT